MKCGTTYTHVNFSLVHTTFHQKILFYSIVLVLSSVVYFSTIVHNEKQKRWALTKNCRCYGYIRMDWKKQKSERSLDSRSAVSKFKKRFDQWKKIENKPRTGLFQHYRTQFFFYFQQNRQCFHKNPIVFELTFYKSELEYLEKQKRWALTKNCRCYGYIKMDKIQSSLNWPFTNRNWNRLTKFIHQIASFLLRSCFTIIFHVRT
jgi:hypothetical protein